MYRYYYVVMIKYHILKNSNNLSEPHTTLREVQVPTLTIVACRSAYTNKINVIDSRVICAGAEGKDACQVFNQAFYLFR